MEMQALKEIRSTEVELKKVDSLTMEERNEVLEIARNINIHDSQAILQFGIGAQSKISNFADQVISEVRSKDGGQVGEVLTDLVLKIKGMDVDSLSPKGSFVSRIPVIGSMSKAAGKFMEKYQKMSVEIEKIIDELDRSKMMLLKDITILDALFAKNLDYLKELDRYILAGDLKLSDLHGKVIPEARAKAEASTDPVEAQRLNDLLQMVNRFEKKLHDLKLSRMVSIQTIPQIRLIQNNNQLLVEKIQSSILNTIPLWKNQIVIAITLFRQKKALAVQKEVTDATNDLLTRNSELLKDTSLGVARESERGIVEIETLKKVNADLISTIEETLKIQQEGRQKRQMAETELTNMENELKEKLVRASS